MSALDKLLDLVERHCDKSGGFHLTRDEQREALGLVADLRAVPTQDDITWSLGWLRHGCEGYVVLNREHRVIVDGNALARKLESVRTEERAATREACATLCEEWARSNLEAFTEQALAAESCAAQIRRQCTDSPARVPMPSVSDEPCTNDALTDGVVVNPGDDAYSFQPGDEVLVRGRIIRLDQGDEVYTVRFEAAGAVSRSEVEVDAELFVLAGERVMDKATGDDLTRAVAFLRSDVCDDAAWEVGDDAGTIACVRASHLAALLSEVRARPSDYPTSADVERALSWLERFVIFGDRFRQSMAEELLIGRSKAKLGAGPLDDAMRAAQLWLEQGRPKDREALIAAVSEALRDNRTDSPKAEACEADESGRRCKRHGLPLYPAGHCLEGRPQVST